MEFTFTTTIDAWFLDLEVDVEITYTTEPARIEKQFYSKPGYEIEVLETKYTRFGKECDFEGKTWMRLERIAHERAVDHFFTKEAA